MAVDGINFGVVPDNALLGDADGIVNQMSDAQHAKVQVTMVKVKMGSSASSSGKAPAS